jgi:hypothetical protein
MICLLEMRARFGFSALGFGLCQNNALDDRSEICYDYDGQMCVNTLSSLSERYPLKK